MNSYPRIFDQKIEIEMVPVDFVSKSICLIALKSSSYGKTYNVVNPSTFITKSGLTNQISIAKYSQQIFQEDKNSLKMVLNLKDIIETYKEMGYKDFKYVTLTEWVDQIKTDPKNPLFSLIDNFKAPPYGFYVRPAHHQNLLNAINGHSVHCHWQNRDLLKLYIRYFIEVNWIPPPPQ